jgi:hypothetical protein
MGTIILEQPVTSVIKAGSRFFWNSGTFLQHCTLSKPRRKYHPEYIFHHQIEVSLISNWYSVLNIPLFLSCCAAQPDETVHQHRERCGEAAVWFTNCDFHTLVHSCWIVHWSTMEFPFLVIFFSSEKYMLKFNGELVCLMFNDMDVFISCSWVDTRWQYTFTHKHYTEHHN